MQNSDVIYLLCAIVLHRYFFSRRSELKLRSASHDDTGNTTSQYQSAYRTGHSTETAPLEVLDGVYTAADDKQISVLIGLELSAAFDTVDHSLLLERLHSEQSYFSSEINFSFSFYIVLV